MDFLKIIRPPVVQQGESTESVVRRAVSLCGADGEGANGSDKLQGLLREADDVFDVVNLLAKSFGVRPTNRELSSVETLGELAALFDAYRKRKASNVG
jgi:hypothetical protein